MDFLLRDLFESPSESHSVVSNSATPWTIQSIEFSRPEHWSGQSFPSPGNLPNPGIEPRSPALQAYSLSAEPPGKPKSTGVGSLSLLHWIFLTQESNCGLLHCRWILYQLSDQESCSGNLLEVKCVLKYFEGMDNGDFSLVRNIIPSFLSLPMRLGY